MSETVKKQNQGQAPESYSPKKPKILSMAENAQTVEEVLVTVLNEDFSIVKCTEKHVVGIRLICPPLARLNSIDIVRRSILEGTCGLLEKLMGNKNPGQYIAVMCDIRTGVDFTYIIGVEVEDGTVLPDELPPDTVTFTIPAATFGKRRKKYGESANNALSSFSYSDFRKDLNYTYSNSSYPFSYYDNNAEMLYTYQPVKQPQSDEEKYDSVSYEVVTLPDVKIIAKSGDNGECMWNFFKEMNTAEATKSAKLHLGNLVAFGGRNSKGEQGAYFGSRVTHFEDTPEGFDEVVYPSRLFVRMYQKQTNNDNASILFDGGKDFFFKTHPEYEIDYTDKFYDLFNFQYEQGVEVYVPIKKKGGIIYERNSKKNKPNSGKL